jgi:hypothetical protein
MNGWEGWEVAAWVFSAALLFWIGTWLIDRSGDN